MDIISIINKKKNKLELSEAEINYFINNYTSNNIADYQASALLMAITINGMTDDEIYYLTNAMLKSGDQIQIPQINKIKIDKHSTGGVGDKISLITLPILSVFNFAVPKMSGRGLGITGGTIDKLESIKGFEVEITEKEFEQQVEDIGIAIIGQTKNLVPADKKLYALRDVTGTVDSIGLITASILSKKLAFNSDFIALDIKCGSGAFMANFDDAKELAQKLVLTGKRFGRKIIAKITDMDSPLGRNIGNVLEVEEAVDFLKGNYKDARLKELVFEMCYGIIKISPDYANLSQQEIYSLIDKVIKNGESLEKLEQMIQYQKGDIKSLYNLEHAQKTYIIKAPKNGFITKYDAHAFGEAALELGAGRKTKEDIIDKSVGIEILVGLGEKVQKNDEIIKIHYNDENKLKSALNKINNNFTIEQNQKIKPIIMDIIQ